MLRVRVAADEVLGAEHRCGRGVGVERDVGFDILRRAERPARPAHALVLDRGHDVLGAPVDGLGERAQVKVVRDLDAVVRGGVILDARLRLVDEAVGAAELVGGKVGELYGGRWGQMGERWGKVGQMRDRGGAPEGAGGGSLVSTLVNL